MKLCTHCGVETPGRRFCTKCGTAFELVPTAFTIPSNQLIKPPPMLPAMTRSRSMGSEPSFLLTSTDKWSPFSVAYLRADATNNQLLSQRSKSARNVRDADAAVGDAKRVHFSEQPQYARPLEDSVDSGTGSRLSLFKGRYTDHPSCDLCFVEFDVTRHRRQCRLCGLFICPKCSPQRLLIPKGDQIYGVRGYTPAEPQLVCVDCVPLLAPVQDELIARVAPANQQFIEPVFTAKKSRSRINAPFSASLEKECRVAAEILGNFFHFDDAIPSDRAIPISLLENAHGIAVMIIVRVGFLVTGTVGTGLVVARLPDGSWSAPSAIGTIGLGGGFEAGGEIVEVMITLGSPAAVKVFHAPQVNLGAGLDVVVGPYGRSAAAAAAVSSKGMNVNYSYSMSKGLYAGISLQGSVTASRKGMNRKFYVREHAPSELLDGSIGQPAAAKPLYDALDVLTKGVEEQVAMRKEISDMMGVCRTCPCVRHIAHKRQVWNKKCKACGHGH